MRKLMWFTLGFAVAAALCAYILPVSCYLPAIIACCLLLGVSLLCLLKWKQARLPAVVMFGLVVCLCWNWIYDSIFLIPVRDYDGQRGYITVTATDDAVETTYGFRVDGQVELNKKTYSIRVYLSEKYQPKLGDSVSGTFLLRSTLSGGSRDSAYNRGEGIYLIASSGKDIVVESPDQLPLSCYPTYIRHQITALMEKIFPEDTLAFARALLLGDTEGIDYETDTDLKLSGIRHVIAVSGLHVTILFALLSALFFHRRWLVALVGLPCLLFFAAVVGFTPSITRACLMHAVMMVSMLVDREYDPPTALSFACLVILVWNPFAILSISFQLSVGCMIGIFLFSEGIQAWLLDRNRLGKFRFKRLTNWFAVSVGISIGATIVTTPLCAIYFGTVSLISVLTNLLTLWVVTYVFYGILLACFLGIFYVPMGAAVAWAVSWGIRYVLATAGICADFPLSAVYVDSIYIVFWLVFCYLLLGIFLRMKPKRPLILSCCVAIGLFVSLGLSWAEAAISECRVTVMDVGQGQCILLQSQGKNFLVDCGGDSDKSAADTAAGQLLSQGISRLDGLIITHYDKDHVGGASLLLTRVEADALYLPNSRDEDSLSGPLTSYQNAPVYIVEQLTVLTFGNTRITLIPSKMAIADNESGLCILFQTENCDILITGDRGFSGEAELMQTITLPDLEVLIAGHHGSKYSTSQELLDATNPEIVMISAGKNNTFGHPAPELLERLLAHRCAILRTDQMGTVRYRG